MSGAKPNAEIVSESSDCVKTDERDVQRRERNVESSIETDLLQLRAHS